jgi:8-oxo-dGTP pyrophosphatase MutT (NUDIX family)
VAHPDGVAKAGPPAHVTASCLVLDPGGERVLLTLHRKANEWFQFGGHLEVGDPTLWQAARREAREESGIDTLEPLPHPVQLDRHTLVGSFGTCREHLDVRYAAVAPVGATAQVSAESHDVRWWPVDALPEGTRAELGPLVSLVRDALGFG